MKKIFVIVLSLFLALPFISCASTSFFTDSIENEVVSSEVVSNGR